MTFEKIRVRFAPSPTGPLHIGGVRTALFNYLFAKKYNGDFILRIEDTDQTRYVPGAEEYIIESLKWCGIEPNEGVNNSGEYGPYRQSERKSIYKQYAEQLVLQNNAYYAFDTPEELENMREKLKKEGNSNQQYNAETREMMSNSLTISKEEVQNKIHANIPYVIRLKLPENEDIFIKDIVLGDITFNTTQLDDKIIFKSDGMPTYHLANVVDDHLMKISHVIRGSEWVNSTPFHVLLYRFFAWEQPIFAHMPLILKPNGKGKLSKRDGDKGGFPVFPLEWINPETKEISSGYRESGYLPKAFINMLAFLGWNPGTTQEIFTEQELIKAFSIDRIGKSGARFDPEKSQWYNHQYLQIMSDEDVATQFQNILNEKGFYPEKGFVIKVISLLKERANFIHDLWDLSFYFFVKPSSYDEKIIKKRWKENIPIILKSILDKLNFINNFTPEEIETITKEHIQSNELNMSQVMNCLRLTIVGSASGPSLFDIMSLIGKEESLHRIQIGIDTIKQ
jgi:glutamyl-tRNA synthetase